MQNYLDFKTEYIDLCARFGRDTKRKIANDLKKDIIELEYQINAIQPQIELKGFSWFYGEVYHKPMLKDIKTELEYTKQLLTEI